MLHDSPLLGSPWGRYQKPSLEDYEPSNAAVAAESYLTSTQDLSTFTADTWTTVTGWTSRIDTDGIYTTDDWTVPAGKSGIYLVEFCAVVNQITSARPVYTQVYLNGSAVTGASVGAGWMSIFNGNERYMPIASTIFDLLAGDILTAKIYPGINSAGQGYLLANATSGQTTFKVVRLGA